MKEHNGTNKVGLLLEEAAAARRTSNNRDEFGLRSCLSYLCDEVSFLLYTASVL
jgi:hypothetical protein